MTRNYNKHPLRIFIAAGHGGADPGAVCGHLREAELNLNIALLLEQDLKRHGVQVKLSRMVDEDDRLHEEIAECNAYAPDFAVAIHTNASADGNASGFEVYYQQSSWANQQYSHRMAMLFDTNVNKYMNVSTRGVKANSSFAWLNKVTAPCILVESFFINGPKAAWYSAPEQLAKLARIYARSILEYYGISYRSDTAQTVHLKVYHSEDDMRDCVCPGFLLNGHYYVQLRDYEKRRGEYVVSFDAHTGIPVVYNPQYFAESPYGDGLLPLGNYASEAERILAGLDSMMDTVYDDTDTDSDYDFDEYDYNDAGQLYRCNSLTH